MRARQFGFFLVFVFLIPPVQAGEARKPAARTFQVPYRLTDTNHVLVRVKINGKGPFNFILDTGAPALFVATKVARKAGVKLDAKGWGTFARFEIEGGVVIANAHGRVEDPFQLEGMNGLGLAGVELHGMIGYNILAKYRLQFDFTKDKMGWTPLDYKPPPPAGLGSKGGTPAELDALGVILKVVGLFLGKKTAPPPAFGGFMGIDLYDTQAGVAVKSVLPQGPAARAGLKPGDRITRFQSKAIKTRADMLRLAAKLTAGSTVHLTINRKGDTKHITLKAKKGF